MSYPAIVFDWCSQQVTKHWGWWPARLCKTWCICLTNTLVVLVLKGGGNWYGAVSAPLIKAQWANDPHHEGQHHSLLITLCSLFTNFYHSIVALCNFFFFWWEIQAICNFSPHRCLLIFQQGGRILHTKFKPDLGPPFPFVLWQTLCSADFPPLPVQVPKTVIQNENNPCPTSITLNPSADESFKHLTRAAHYVLFQTNFCFWQCMERIKIARSAAGKNKLN